MGNEVLNKPLAHSSEILFPGDIVRGVSYQENCLGTDFEDLMSISDSAYGINLISKNDHSSCWFAAFTKNDTINQENILKQLHTDIQQEIGRYTETVANLQLHDSKTIVIGENFINTYVFTSINDQDLIRIASNLSEISSFSLNTTRAFPKNIVILPNRDDKTYANTIPNGQYVYLLDTLFLYQRAFDEPNHRIPGVNNLKGTLAHETGHFHTYGYGSFALQWIQAGNWRRAPKIFYTTSPEKCVNDYAKLSPDEDIAESFVAYLFQPDLLKTIAPQKMTLFNNYFHKNENENRSIVPYQINNDAAPTPIFPSHFKFSIVQNL